MEFAIGVTGDHTQVMRLVMQVMVSEKSVNQDVGCRSAMDFNNNIFALWVPGYLFLNDVLNKKLYYLTTPNLSLPYLTNPKPDIIMIISSVTSQGYC